MWQNLIVIVIVAAAASYIGWTVFRSIQGSAGACGGGCGSGCGAKSNTGDLVQLGSSPPENDSVTSPDQSSAVSSKRS